MAHYRQAWSEFNLGETSKAIHGLSNMLVSPKLLTRSGGSEVISVDEQFKAEVSRDLATFYTKTKATVKDAHKIFKLSPEATKLDNIDYFASELERVGQKETAAEVWAFVLDSQPDPRKRFENHIRLAQLNRESNKIEASLEHFRQSLLLWSQMGECNESICKEWKSRIRKYVLDWNRDEKKSSVHLVSAYKQYLNIFKKETDMILWGAQASKKIKNWKQAEQFYSQAFHSRTLSTAKDLPSQEKIALLYIELGELSKDKALQKKAYSFYLANSLEKTKFVEVKYQLAHAEYEDKNYLKAAESLKAVALLKMDQSPKIKRQAADLALDALVVLKRDEEIESWSKTFASVFKDKSSEYADIARKSVLNQTAQFSSNTNDKLATDKAWVSLARVNINGASPDVKLTYYKNKMLLAEKLKKYDEMGTAANEIVLLKNATEEDKQIALGKRAWLAELRLDFKSALEANKKLKLSSLTPAQKSLKLAMLSELSGNKNNKYFDQFLKQTKDKEKAKHIALMKIKASSNKPNALRTYKKYFVNDPDLFAHLHYVDALERNNFKVANKLNKNSKFSKTKNGRSIWRVDFLNGFDSLKGKVVAHELKSDNQKQLSKSLKKRAKLLENIEISAALAAKKEDWLSQVVFIDLLANQSERFYKELISLPMPEGLEPAQQQEYLQLLSQQASPYNIKAQELKATFQKFWENPGLIENFETQAKNCEGVICDRFSKELNYAAVVAPENLKLQLIEIGKKSSRKPAMVLPDIKTIEMAKQKVRQDPMNRIYLEELLNVEKQAGNNAMVSYLKERVKKTQNSGESL